VVAGDLRLPAAVSIYGDQAVIGELNGRVTILDKAGKVVTQVGANTEAGVGGNQMKPEQWRTGFLVSPHGVAVTPRGDLFVAEFSSFGRVHRFNKN
jgi:DNA-binding beta-propeller fold protein YncE